MAALGGLQAAHGTSSGSHLVHRACVYEFMNVCLSVCSGVEVHLWYTCFWSCHPVPKPPTNLTKWCWVKDTESNTLWSTERTRDFLQVHSLLSSNPKPLHLVCVCVSDLHCITLANNQLPTLPAVYTVMLETLTQQWVNFLKEGSLKPTREEVWACFCLSLTLSISSWSETFLLYLAWNVATHGYNKSEEYQETFCFSPTLKCDKQTIILTTLRDQTTEIAIL